MAHLRQRHLTSLLLKKLKFNPILAVQGARQTGKSALLREILPEYLPQLEYLSFDQFKNLDFADKNPGLFLAQHQNASPLVIDEAQKVPKIFDEIKFEVDQKRTPGRYILSGSTEFSKLTLIREALTGRMTRVRLYPLNLAETLDLPPNSSEGIAFLNDHSRITKAQLMLYLERGGMPGIFATRDKNERESLMQDWLDLTTQRDVALIPKLKVDPGLCTRILEKIATQDEPSAGAISKALKTDLRKIKSHLNVLETLFVIHPLDPHPMSTGKTLYFLCDVGFARLLQASFERVLYTWLIQEQLSQRAYRDDRDTKLYFYRTAKGSYIHLILENSKENIITALKLLSEERFSEKEFEVLKAFRNKVPEKNVVLSVLGSSRITLKSPAGNIEVYPWEALG